MCLLTVITNIFAIVGIYFIVRDTIMPFLKQIICKNFSQSNGATSQNDNMSDQYIEIDDYTKSWRISSSGCQNIRKPSVWSVSSLSSTSSTSSLDIDFSLPLPLCPLTSTRNYSRKSSIWSVNSDCYYTTYSTGSTSSSMYDYSVGSSDISSFKWSTSSNSRRPLLTSLSGGSSSLTSLDEDVFQDDTLSFKGGYYTLTTINTRDMFSLSSDLHDTDASADSAISSGGITPECPVDSAFNTDVDTPIYSCGKTPHFSFASEIDSDAGVDSAIYSSGITPDQSNENDLSASQFDDTPYPIVDVAEYEKPPGPSPYGMRRRRVFTFSSIVKNLEY